MIFAQPGFLWALPAVAVPLIIHLLNRLRYRPVRWAATMFVTAAARSSPRRARWRHYLILACRMLAVLFVILAMTRPRAWGLVSLFGASGPDAVIVLLDRSASMERFDGAMQSTRRQRAVRAASRAASAMRGPRRYLVLDSATGRAVEFADIGALDRSSVAAATDAGADVPGMLKSALDIISKEQGENFEIWIASDFQAGSWRPDSQEWKSLAARMAGLSKRVRLRIFDVRTDEAVNSSARILDVRRRRVSGGGQVSVLLEIRAGSQGAGPLIMPVTATFGGLRLQTTFDLTEPVSRHRWNLDVPDASGSGWLRVEIPADGNLRDNVSWGVWGIEQQLRTHIVTEDEVFGRILRMAAAPDPTGAKWAAYVATGGNFDSAGLADASLVVWQAGRPEQAVESALETFVGQGGVLLAFPPSAAVGDGPVGTRWKQEEEVAASRPWTVPVWEENEGPLAKTESGRSLPVGRISVKKRRTPVTAGVGGAREGRGAWSVFAAFDDGQAFLVRQVRGAGSVWACASLPTPAWSDLADGRILVPMIQRLAREGAARLSRHRIVECGKWRPEPGAAGLIARDSLAENPDPIMHAGVYESGDVSVAVNRPLVEDDPAEISADEARALMGEISAQIVSADSVLKLDPSGLDVWPLFVTLALCAMIAESWLLVSSWHLARSEGRAVVGK